MATITEDYVSFETAKLLKEKGFPQNPNICNTAYTFRGKLSNNAKSFAYNFTEFNKCGIKPITYSMAPTLQMAMKWIREVHNWTICISPYWPEGDMRNKLTWYYDIHSLIDNRSFRESSYTDNYTEAVEAAIKYCLENLI